VLWLDEDFLTATHRPIASLERVKCSLEQEASSLKIPSLAFVLLGPQDSTTLMVMLEEPNPPPLGNSNLDWPIYSFAASAEEKRY
jgi:hypothetical protein